mgnify:CR=1 FL=1
MMPAVFITGIDVFYNDNFIKSDVRHEISRIKVWPAKRY